MGARRSLGADGQPCHFAIAIDPNKDDEKHFVLWHGRYQGYHWVSDPSRGEMWLSAPELFTDWTMVAAWVFQDGKPIAQLPQERIAQAFARR
ncbi:MAG: hypothetical protein HC848_05625 [Limnobacter sp.]|nr:hypothetical protein [Limnobacter sp.]